jgi:hypothetical protein
MIYFENSLSQGEGFNTHVMRYTMCIALSNFLDRDFFFASGRPSTTPPDYALQDGYKKKFEILMTSRRSEVFDLVVIPNRRSPEIDRSVSNKIEVQMIMSYFFTTREMKDRFENSFIWNAFAVGRFAAIREELQSRDLIEFTHQTLSSPAYSFFLPRREKEDLLRSVRIKYLDEIESFVAPVSAELGKFYAVHIRLGDFLKIYAADEYAIAEEKYKEYISVAFPDRAIPVLIATDALHEKEVLQRLFEGYRTIFIDEFIFDNYVDEYRRLPFTDFNVLTIIDQLLCVEAELFIGTYRSTFTSIIHRLRQERRRKKDFNFFPDKRVSKLIGDSQTIKPDRSGFFDWNRYSVFATDHHDMSWRREWDHDLTTIDI